MAPNDFTRAPAEERRRLAVYIVVAIIGLAIVAYTVNSGLHASGPGNVTVPGETPGPTPNDPSSPTAVIGGSSTALRVISLGHGVTLVLTMAAAGSFW